MRHADVHEVLKTVTDGAAGLRQLNDRSREVFKRIVETYLATGEPVGSRNLSRALPMTLSPASVRNVMSDLEGLGLVYAPHTSAGRLPTQTGLRLFIDGLLEIGDVTEEERSQIESRIAAGGRRRGVEDVLAEAGEMLSGLSRGAGVVLV
jgi:heat-inducible transcriptional repressor